jgi:hypothetical protein
MPFEDSGSIVRLKPHDDRVIKEGWVTNLRRGYGLAGEWRAEH